MNIPILQRIRSMFSAKADTPYNDSLTDYVFTCLCMHSDAPEFSSIIDLDDRNILEECYIYVHRDRPRLVNMIIEAGLRDEQQELEEQTENLRQSDSYYLKLLVDTRSYIW